MLIYLVPIFLFLVLYFPLNIKVEYSREGQNDDFKLELYTFIRLFGITICIPYLQNRVFDFFTEIFAEIDLLFLNIKGEKDKEIEKEVEWNNEQIEKLKKLLTVIFDRDLVNLLFSNLKIHCHHLKWKTEFGLADPAYTAIVNGFIWTLKGVFIKLTDELLLFKNQVKLIIEPDFYNVKFSTFFIGIFSNRIGNIIITMIKVLLYKIKSTLKSKGVSFLKK